MAWVKMREVAEALGVHRNTAARRAKARQIPGASMLYKLDDGREVWAVDRDAWEAFLAGRRRKLA